LGPTSTCPDLAFLMCNQAKVTSGSFVFDPYVGTGSILLAVKLFGGLGFGADLDYRVVMGKGVGRLNKNSSFYNNELENYFPKINLNFIQNNLPLPNIVRSDSTKLKINHSFKFDSIISDPPYGLRATSIRIAANSG